MDIHITIFGQTGNFLDGPGMTVQLNSSHGIHNHETLPPVPIPASLPLFSPCITSGTAQSGS
jgi:hypothetical protein